MFAFRANITTLRASLRIFRSLPCRGVAQLLQLTAHAKKRPPDVFVAEAAPQLHQFFQNNRLLFSRRFFLNFDRGNLTQGYLILFCKLLAGGGNFGADLRLINASEFYSLGIK